MLKVVKADGRALRHARRDLMDDQEILREAVNTYGPAKMFPSEYDKEKHKAEKRQKAQREKDRQIELENDEEFQRALNVHHTGIQ